jgi:uncharacterized ParB-like nuclease family protein
MRRFTLFALAVAPFTIASAQAQEFYPPPGPSQDGVALVSGWVHQYLGRGPNHQDVVNGRNIDAGLLDPIDVLAGVLSCDEFYIKGAGCDDQRYVQRVFRDLVGRAPSRREADYWRRCLREGPDGMDGRTAVVYGLIQQVAPGPPADRPAYDRNPYDRERDFDHDRRRYDRERDFDHDRRR